jgi:hypothetical protein
MKSMITSAILTLALLVVAGCSADASTNPDSLIGTYAIEEHGKLEDFVRIEKKNGEYLMYDKNQNDQWTSDPDKVVPVTKKDLESILGHPVSVPYASLGSNGAAIFKMPAGWGFDDFKTKTGYWVATMMGPIELHKR